MDWTGRTLLQYRFVEKIGEGGMGVVWKARDTSLDRDVAIKILPEEVAGDAARLARFEREARLLATLDHPNIATVHGLHEEGGVRFLAMELAPGEDLSRRLARGALPVDEALQLALQLTEALDAAHERGVIHRDLKPANVQVAEDGRVKVLDFGLAKAFERAEAGSPSTSPSMSPTITSLGTVAGTILGTAGYMSPEQAKGREADKRSDVWAFGVVLYEMLAGSNPFLGETVAETLAAVLKETPDWTRLPAETPAGIRRLLRRCLEKRPADRLRDIGDARLMLREAIAGTEDVPAPMSVPAASVTRTALPWVLCGLLAAALLWSLPGRGRDAAADPGATPVHVSVVLPDDGRVLMANPDLEVMPALAVSPRGDRLVYSTHGKGDELEAIISTRRLRVRRFDSPASEPLRGSEHASGPFFSPDGEWIGYFDGTRLLKMPASGGAAVSVAEGIGPGCGASWTSNGRIVFAHSYRGPLWIVSEDGGAPRELTTLGSDELSHRYPHVLPGGRAVLFTIKQKGLKTFDEGRLAVADMTTGEYRVLPVEGMDARYVPPGFLVYGRGGSLLAAPFALERLEIRGGAIPVLDGIFTNPVTGTVVMDVSPTGRLAYVAGDYSSGPTRLWRYGRDGSRVRLAEDDYVMLPSLSPDGTRLALHGPAANDRVLLLDLKRGSLLAMTDSSSNTIDPTWLGDDTLVFTTDAGGPEEIVTIPADGGTPELLLGAFDGGSQEVSDATRDGRLLALARGSRASSDIWTWDRDRSDEPEPYVTTDAHESYAAFSPGGDWIAYASDESGSTEVYLRPYPGRGGKVQISSGGGSFPRWRGDGREIYYQTPGRIVAVPVAFEGGRARPGSPRDVLSVPTATPVGFDVSADGKFFYVVELDVDAWRASSIEVVLNWDVELADRLQSPSREKRR